MECVEIIFGAKVEILYLCTKISFKVWTYEGSIPISQGAVSRNFRGNLLCMDISKAYLFVDSLSVDLFYGREISFLGFFGNSLIVQRILDIEGPADGCLFVSIVCAD